MNTTFKHGQTNYSLVVAPEGRRERDKRIEDIKADPTIMTPRAKGKGGQSGSNQHARKQITED